MKLKQFFTEDDGVSPVIGVILMVAITVILAAVIASFVLGLGDTADEVQPNSNFAFDVDLNDNGDELTITLTDGEAIDEDEIFIRGSAIDGDDELAGGNLSLDDEWSVGESVTLPEDYTGSDAFDNPGGEDVNVVWEESGGDSAATLGTFELPDDFAP